MASEIETGTVEVLSTDTVNAGEFVGSETPAASFTVSGGASRTYFTGFDPSLGTLEDVKVTFSMDGTASGYLSPYAGAITQDFETVVEGSLLFLSGSNSNPLVTLADDLNSAIQSPIEEFTPEEGATPIGPFPMGATSAQLTLGPDTGFVGGTYELGFSFHFGATEAFHTGPLNEPGYYHASDGDSLTADVTATVSIEYDYTPAAACYLANTKIQTPRGPVPIERLSAGDHVVTASGRTRPIRWIGRRSYGGRFLRANRTLWPVVIKAGALDEQVPSRDLSVSPRHAMFLDGVLVPAERLINGVTIVQPEPGGPVAYFHIELATHDIIIAEGAASESFVDDDCRAMFHNARDYAAMYPDAKNVPAVYCAPRVTEGFTLKTIRQRLDERAGIRRAPPRLPLRGFIDTVRDDRVEGWAQNSAYPEAPVCLDILVDGAVVAKTLANQYRADLKAAGLGSGRHAFVVTLADSIRCGEDRLVVVRRSSDFAELPRAKDSRMTA